VNGSACLHGALLYGRSLESFSPRTLGDDG